MLANLASFLLLLLFTDHGCNRISPFCAADRRPMGWNSWNHFGGGVSAKIMKGTADAFLSRGLAAVGYEYVNTDDGWLNLKRNATTGQLVRAVAVH